MGEDISVLRYEDIGKQGSYLQQSVFYTWGVRTTTVPGILRLVQMVVKMMLTTVGSDIFAPSIGTIIPTLVRKGVSASSKTTVRADIMSSIQDLERQIFALQATENIPDEERLKQIEIRKVEYLDISNEWNIQLSVESNSGQALTFDLAPLMKGQ